MSRIKQEIDMGPLTDYFQEGTKFYKNPELPTRQFKYKGVKYTVSDLRLLHPAGNEALTFILSQMAHDKDVEECVIPIHESVDEETIEIVEAIVMGFSYKAEKGGKNGWMTSGCLVYGCSFCENRDGTRELKFIVSHDAASAIHDLMSTHSGELTLLDIVVHLADTQHKGIDEWRRENE